MVQTRCEVETIKYLQAQRALICKYQRPFPISTPYGVFSYLPSQTAADRWAWVFSYGAHPRGKTEAFFSKINTTGVQLLGSPDWLYSRFFIAY